MLDWRTGQGGVAPCALDPQVCEGSADGVLVLYSLSKQSNMAGYRTAFIAGDYALVARMTAYRKQIGQIIPGPVQAAMAEGLRDGDAVREQKARYERRLSALVGALRAYGYDAAMPQGALYVWVKARSGDCWRDMADLARLGIVPSPGEFYGAPESSAVLRHRHRWGDRRRLPTAGRLTSGLVCGRACPYKPAGLCSDHAGLCHAALPVSSSVCRRGATVRCSPRPCRSAAGWRRGPAPRRVAVRNASARSTRYPAPADRRWTSERVCSPVPPNRWH